MNDFDLINRKEVLKARPEYLNSSIERITEKWTLADRSYARGWNACVELWLRRIASLPSAQPERKKGKWITDKYGHVVCSECNWNAPRIMTGCLVNRHLDYDKSDYCWHCGADMRGEQE